MKLTVKRADLLEGLGKVMLATKAGLRTCRFTAKGGELALFSEGDCVAIATAVKAKVTAGGEVALDADKVMGFLRADPDPIIMVSATTKKYMGTKKEWHDGKYEDVPVAQTKTVATLTGRYSITDELEVRAALPKLPKIPKFTSSIPNLADALREVRYAADSNTYAQRPILAGVCFDGDRLAAADGFRLAVTKLHNRGKLNFILPVRAVSIIMALATPKMQVAVDKDHRAIFQAGKTTIISRTIAGTFPHYEQLIPKKGKKVVFSTKLLKDAITAALKLKGDHLVIESKGRKGAVVTGRMEKGAYYSANQSTSTFSATVPCRGRIRICLIGKQLADLLAHVPTTEVVVRFEDQNKPILVKNNGSQHVLMPVCLPKKTPSRRKVWALPHKVW